MKTIGRRVLLLVLSLAALPATPSAHAEDSKRRLRICLNHTTTNWVKYMLGIQRQLDRVPHVFISLEDGYKQIDSAGFYGPAQIVREQIEPFEYRNGAYRECMPLSEEKAGQCQAWMEKARAAFAAYSASSKDRGPPPRLGGLDGAPPPPDPQNYDLAFNNCSDFAVRAWRACTGQSLKDKSWFPQYVRWPPALKVAL